LRRHRNRRNDIRNAGSAGEISVEEGSPWKGKYDEDNLNIVTGHVFSESSRSGSSKGQGHPRGTPTMFIEIIEVKGLWCVGGGVADRGYT
jgi:hypothetical protein